MMTVAEEVDRAVQIANVPQEVSSSSKVPEFSNRSASEAASTAPSENCPSQSSSPGNVVVQRSPAFSLGSPNCPNNDGEVKADENAATIGGCCYTLCYTKFTVVVVIYVTCR